MNKYIQNINDNLYYYLTAGNKLSLSKAPQFTFGDTCTWVTPVQDSDIFISKRLPKFVEFRPTFRANLRLCYDQFRLQSWICIIPYNNYSRI